MRATSGMLSVPRVVRAVATALLLVGCSEPTALVQDGAKVGSVVVTPLSGSVNVGSTMQLTATVLDTSGQVIAQPSLSWRSSDTLIARISAAGVVRGVVPGTVTITARSSTKEGSAHVVVAQLDTGGTKPDTGAVDFAAIVRGIRPRGYGATPYALLSPASGSRVWYVSPSGNDAATGDASSPLKTVNRAAQLAKAGDVVTIRAGTYNEGVSVKNSGTVTQPIVFQAEQRGTVVLSGGHYTFQSADWSGDQQTTGEFYITLRGLIFRRYNDPQSTDDAAAAIRASKGWKIEDCLLDEPGRVGIEIRYDDVVITRTTIQRAYIDAIGSWTPTSAALGPNDAAYDPLSGLQITDVILQENNITPNPLLGDLADYGAKLWGTRGALIDNMESYGNYGPGFWFDTDNSDYTVRNSYFHDNHPVAGSDNEYGKGLFLEVSWASGLVERNVFENNGGAGLAMDNVQGVEVRNNLFVGNAHCATFVNGDRGNNPDGKPRWPLKNIKVHDNLCRDWTDVGAMATIYGTFGSPSSMGVVVDANVYQPIRNMALADWFNIGTFSQLSDVRSKLGWEATGRIGTITVP